MKTPNSTPPSFIPPQERERKEEEQEQEKGTQPRGSKSTGKTTTTLVRPARLVSFHCAGASHRVADGGLLHRRSDSGSRLGTRQAAV